MNLIMKRKLFISGLLLMVVAGMTFWSCQKDEVLSNSDALKLKSTEILEPLVEPTTVDDWKSGDAEFECGQVEVENCAEETFAYKVDEWDEENGMDGSYEYEGLNIALEEITNTIEISNSTGKTFDWTSEMPVCKVIVKAGTKAYVYDYSGETDPVYGDAGLVAPEGKDISHVTFCFYEMPPGNPECEWIGETAWSAGTRYVTRGNWATWTPYVVSEEPVILYAGQTEVAGGVKFSVAWSEDDVDYVTITIKLESGWRLKEIEGEIVDEAVKVQGYASAPKSNPSPGSFTYYKGTELSFDVEKANIYGIHLDVEWEDCSDTE
jgi:hypothetical protein